MSLPVMDRTTPCTLPLLRSTTPTLISPSSPAQYHSYTAPPTVQLHLPPLPHRTGMLFCEVMLAVLNAKFTYTAIYLCCNWVCYCCASFRAWSASLIPYMIFVGALWTSYTFSIPRRVMVSRSAYWNSFSALNFTRNKTIGLTQHSEYPYCVTLVNSLIF